jgi:hypothetical protein
MPIIAYGNSSYLLYILMLVLLTYIIYLFLKPRSERFRFFFLFSLLVFAFVLHFAKIFIVDSYREGLPYSLTLASLENICAVSTVFFPFLFLSKNKTIKDYMVIVGSISGLVAFLIPAEGLGRLPFQGNVIRFYIAHYIIFVVPFMMAKLKMHQIDYRRLWKLPLMVYFVMFIVLINELFLNLFGIVNATFADYQSGNFRNTAFVFGIPDILEPFKSFVYFLTPKIFLKNPFTDTILHWPIIWAAIPIYVYGYFAGTMAYFYFDGERTRVFFKELFYKKLTLFKSKETKKDET